jgi:hypothetical protein
MKKCKICNIEKELSNFYERKDRKSGVQSMCKSCFSTYCSDRWISKKIMAIKYKGSKCNDCELSYPNYPYVIFDFHHLNPKEKDFDWSKLKLRGESKIKFELDKCVLLCSNCHRIRHHNNFLYPRQDSNL